jgi:hypothetical protein
MLLLNSNKIYISLQYISFVITVAITKVIFQLVVISIQPKVGSVSVRLHLKNRTKLSIIPQKSRIQIKYQSHIN